jgi:lipopolysaccharide/colanic/teichoic acid biosynthesis glycosyltransferase
MNRRAMMRLAVFTGMSSVLVKSGPLPQAQVDPCVAHAGELVVGCDDLATVGGEVAAAWAEGRGVWVESATLAPLAARLGLPIEAGKGRLHFGSGERSGLDHWASRILQWVVAGALLVLGMPLWLLLACAVIADDWRGPFHLGKRTGLRGSTFRCMKFRTMRVGAEAGEHLRERREFVRGKRPPYVVMGGRGVTKNPDDPRVTRVGRALRRSGIDEAPQFLHVLRGRMNLVGPRPYVVEETAAFEPWHTLRERVAPGITGLWQVNGRSEVSFDESVILDLYYISHASLWLDLRIMLATPWRMLAGIGGY